MSANSHEARRFIDVAGCQIHFERLGPERSDGPVVFLHEGLGSVELWRGFPGDVVERTGRQGLIYSRCGNGWSTSLHEPRRLSYMHDEALEVLPEVLDRLTDGVPVLVGHSDGASIALIYAGSGHAVRALILIAPHVFVEEETIASIASIRDSFAASDRASRMAKYHVEPETTFHGWADVWLSDGFLSWNIEEYLPGVSCPILLIQGEADEYGTTGQLDAIAEGVAGPVRAVMVEDAGHSPHLSHPEPVTGAVVDFISSLD